MDRRTGRRIVALAAIVAGALLLWLSPDALLGAVMVVAGLALEALGVRLDHAA
jgi:drug/metabolite transporter (DMT)-like permease